MNRRSFLKAGAFAGVLPVFGAACNGMPKITPPEKPAQLNLCIQWWRIPAADDVNARLDYLEKNGYAAVEVPSDLKFLEDKGLKIAEQLKTRKLFMSAACGGSRFDRADKAGNDAEVERFTPVLKLLGEMKSTGLIICPARGKPEVGHKELRESFVNDYGKRLAQTAAKFGTTIILEPLQRAETPFLRQVSDAARMAQEIGEGCTVLGDFWHMSKEESSMFAAFVSAGKLLTHVHVASLVKRRIPGTDGAADNYVDGFKGLKFIGYRGPVSLEAGYPPIGFDAKKKPIMPGYDKQHEHLVNMCRLLREQWAEA